MAGETIQCPSCQASIVIPSAQQSAHTGHKKIVFKKRSGRSQTTSASHRPKPGSTRTTAAHSARSSSTRTAAAGNAQQGTYVPVTLGDWMLTMFLVGIPLVGLILMFVWAFGSQTPISKSNWAKAALIWSLIVSVLYGLALLIIAMGAAAMQ